MKWYSLNHEYIKYLKQFDKNVPDIDYSPSQLKPFLGIMLQCNDVSYFCPVTSFKPKFENKKDSIDFFKIVDSTGKSLSALAMNNMIPVPMTEAIPITYENIGLLRSFHSLTEKRKYYRLLNKELKIIQRVESKLMSNAKKLHRIITNNDKHYMKNWCCNFGLLEEKSKEYERNKLLTMFPNRELNEKLVNAMLSLDEKCIIKENKLYVVNNKHEGKSLDELRKSYTAEQLKLREFNTYESILMACKDQIRSDYYSMDDGEFYFENDEISYLGLLENSHEKNYDRIVLEDEFEHFV